MADETEPPKRRYTLEIKLGADTWDDLMLDLKGMAYYLHRYEDLEKAHCVMGGASSGFTVNLVQDKEMTHDRYFELVDTYLDSTDAKKSNE